MDALTAAPIGEAKGLPAFVERHTRTELYAIGEGLRAKCPRSSHAAFMPRKDRDVIALIEEGNQGRIPQLVPVRHGRMLVSPFTFYRGAALHMAADLATTPASGIRVQACGDAHLGNFRGLATPERRIVFDIHDLDETLPAPWEWDLKRLATSFIVACRDNGLDKSDAADAVLTCVGSYRKRMAEFSEISALELWYARLEAGDLIAGIKDQRLRKRATNRIAKEAARSALEYDFPRLTITSGEQVVIRDRVPTIYHWREEGATGFEAAIREGFAQYRTTLSDDRKFLLDRYEFKDIAIKVVGVGSVGTLCAVILMMGGETDPLFLQVKEARASVLEPYAGKSIFSNHGQRVVTGHRLMQSASDIFLGWTEGSGGRHFYIRQLRDAKIKANIETFGRDEMIIFADWCGWSLARSHARSGEAAMIAGYLGKSDIFDNAIVAFAEAYADQTEHDHAALKKAARQTRIAVTVEREY